MDGSPGRAGGREAEQVSPCSWMEPIARALTRDEPSRTKLRHTKRPSSLNQVCNLPSNTNYLSSAWAFRDIKYYCTFRLPCI